MPRSKETLTGIRNLLSDLFTCLPVREKLLLAVREAVPGTPNVALAVGHGNRPAEVLITSRQRDWLVQHLSAEYWGKLTVEQQQLYMNGLVVHDCPFLEGERVQRER